MKVDLKGSFSDLLLLRQLVTLLSSLVPATVELYNTIQLPCFERSFVVLKISFQCLLYREVLGPCALRHGYVTTYLGIETNPEACEMPPDVQALFINLIAFIHDLIVQL